jgi:hypothetical protein
MNRRQVLGAMAAAVPTLGHTQTTPASSQVIHRVSATGKVNAPLDSLDLPAWAFHLTSDEYKSCAPEHHGCVQAPFPGGKPVFISVETIGGSFMVHQYREDVAERTRLRAISSDSQLWWGPKLPTTMKVTWDLRLEPITAQACKLTGNILVETADPALLAAVAKIPPGTPDPVQVHCSRETLMFAADMERKALKGTYPR